MPTTIIYEIHKTTIVDKKTHPMCMMRRGKLIIIFVDGDSNLIHRKTNTHAITIAMIAAGECTIKVVPVSMVHFHVDNELLTRVENEIISRSF
jgi:ABC-type uncharacterized transport system ATPase subunit